MNLDHPVSEADNPSPSAPEVSDEITGLPGLPTWGRVYGFVVGVFVIYVVFLTALSMVFA